MAHEKQNIWSESYKITSPLVNFSGRLGLYGVLNLLQETAWIHAETLGFGMKAMEEKGLYWVITRQNLKMRSWPSFGAQVKVETWIRKPLSGFITREFKIFSRDDHELGTCSTSWLALDRKTRQILPVKDLMDWDSICNEQSTDLATPKISSEGDFFKLADFKVRNSDLDINQHANNTKYAQWILDSIPYLMHKEFRLDGYAVNFLAETHLNDLVEIQGSEDINNEETSLPVRPASGITTYRGLRLKDQKILFTAQLFWSSNLDILHK